MPQDRETAWLVFLVIALVGVLGLFPYRWYRHTYRPGLIASEMLNALSTSLQRATSQWHPNATVSVRGLWAPLVPIYMNDKVEIVVHGNWANAPVSIQFKLDVGMPETGFWGRLNSVGDPGVYYPPVTSVRLTSKRHLAKRTGLIKTSKSENDVNNVLAGLGLAGKYRQVSDDMFAYGEEVKTADFFNSDVLALVSAFPRNLFVHPFDGPVIEDSEITITWEGHETDPKVIEAAFHLLTTISEAAVAAK
jgi:hypothetical protein